jgi:hypothetical protein
MEVLLCCVIFLCYCYGIKCFLTVYLAESKSKQFTDEESFLMLFVLMLSLVITVCIVF